MSRIIKATAAMFGSGNLDLRKFASQRRSSPGKALVNDSLPAPGSITEDCLVHQLHQTRTLPP